MQDMHGIIGEGSGGGGGRFIGVGDRRLRPLSHQPVKCPRCDSANTKFCYYNNYNLAQPRHFCKGCRRYWTKGGVLRNVPVGGGCRKTKRSRAKINASVTVSDESPPPGDITKSTPQSSSSESSSLTTVAAATTTAQTSAEEGSAPIYTTSDSAVMYNFADASFSNVTPRANPNLDQPAAPGSQIFPTEIGSFTGMMMTSSEELMMTSYAREEPANPEIKSKVDELKKMEDMNNEGIAAALGWGSGGDQALFDLTAGVDPAYWSQSDWNDNDQSLNYLP